MPFSQKSENVTNRQFIWSRFNNPPHHINKLAILMLFRHVAYLAQKNFYQNQATIYIYDHFCKRKQGQGLLYTGATVQAQKQKS